MDGILKMALSVLRDCLIVRPDVEKSVLIALLAKGNTGTGTVIGAGPEVIDAKVDKRILFGQSVGQDFRWEGEDLLVMREEHILGVFDDE